MWHVSLLMLDTITILLDLFVCCCCLSEDMYTTIVPSMSNLMNPLSRACCVAIAEHGLYFPCAHHRDKMDIEVIREGPLSFLYHSFIIPLSLLYQ